MDLYAILYWTVIVCFVYLLSVYTMFGLLLMVSAAENMRLARQDRNEDYETLAESRFTIPVSVIAPAYNEEVVITAAVRSLLALDYPEYEVIVVNDGSRDGTLDELKRTFDLRRREMFYRRVFRTRTVRGVYQSRTHPRLLVIDKENGGKADALNCGFNFARYRYVCTVDGDTVFFPNALLKGMRLALKDPARVLGVTSQVAISRRPEETDPARPGTQRIDDKALTNFQMLDYLRAFLNNRVGWSRLDFMLCSVGAFAIWRRDVVAELGGFSGEFTCEDIEFTFRAHEHFRRLKQPYQILSMGDMVGRSEGPDTVGRLISQRARWQRVITETVWHYRRMFMNPRYGSVGFMGVPYYVLVEVLAPIFEVLSVILLPLAWWIGVLSLWELLFFLIAVAFANGAFTNIALMLHDRLERSLSVKEMLRFVLLGPLDLFIYRPILFWAQAKGLFDFLRGDKRWHKFERNRREAA
jgi:biofilm PGA synthesis N-glycosyltransferase PgaC